MDLGIRPVAEGELPSLLAAGEAAKVLPDAYERARLARPGALARSAAWWEVHLRDVEPWRDGASARFCVAHEAEAGPVGGYASSRVKWDDGPGSTLLVDELVAATPESHAVLWRYLCEADLVATVRAGRVDEATPGAIARADAAFASDPAPWCATPF